MNIRLDNLRLDQSMARTASKKKAYISDDLLTKINLKILSAGCLHQPNES